MDYSKGKIYKIYNIIDDDIYIGSTCCPLLSQRLAKHKSCINEPKRCNSKLWRHLGWDLVCVKCRNFRDFI